MLNLQVKAEPISNLDKYTDRMSKSLMDKAFFLDKVESINFVDYGCADGALGDFIGKVFPQYAYIGYDNDPVMVERANRILNKGRDISTFWATDNWQEILQTKHLVDKYGPWSVVANSVIHEVYDYSNADEINTFWDRIFESGFEYICIRDMFRPCWHTEVTGGIWKELNTLTVADRDSVRKVRSKADPALLTSFEEHWGTIDDEDNLIHFLLKYRYVENWDREVKENYLPLTIEDLRDIIVTRGYDYEVDYFEQFSLKHIKDQVKKDFDVTFGVKTHAKVILKRRTYA